MGGDPLPIIPGPRPRPAEGPPDRPWRPRGCRRTGPGSRGSSTPQFRRPAQSQNHSQRSPRLPELPSTRALWAAQTHATAAALRSRLVEHRRASACCAFKGSSSEARQMLGAAVLVFFFSRPSRRATTTCPRSKFQVLFSPREISAGSWFLCIVLPPRSFQIFLPSRGVMPIQPTFPVNQLERLFRFFVRSNLSRNLCSSDAFGRSFLVQTHINLPIGI